MTATDYIMSILISNKKVKKDFGIFETFTGGLALTGQEVKSLKNNQGTLNGAFLILRDNHKQNPELWIKHFSIPPYQVKNTGGGYDPERLRKVLVSKKEINQIQKELNNKGTTIIPLAVHNARNLIKLEFGLARGKKKFDKREDLKKRAQKRDSERETKASFK